MTNDPFERFERSRGGLLIPVLLFILGAVPTALAIRALHDLEVSEEAMDEEPAMEIEPAGEPPDVVHVLRDEESART
jgi:hypothetical protein